MQYSYLPGGNVEAAIKIVTDAWGISYIIIGIRKDKASRLRKTTEARKHGGEQINHEFHKWANVPNLLWYLFIVLFVIS